MDDADAVGRVVVDRAILRLYDIATLAVDNSHLAIFELHNSAVTAKVARPEVVVFDDNNIVLILKTHATLGCKSSARLNDRVDGVALIVGGDAV